MEGRRIEGVFLEASILRNRAQEAYETAKVYEIQILSRISQALLASLGGPGARLRATVRDVNPQRVLLLLENGYEVTAENRLNLPVAVGEELTLVVESEEPLTLRLEGAFQGVRGLRELLARVLREGITPLKPDRLRESLENSGLVYERKVWDYLRGVLPTEKLVSDQKYALLRALEGADISGTLEALKRLSVPSRFSETVKQLIATAEKDTVSFLRGLTALEKEIAQTLSSHSGRIAELRSTTAEVVRTLVESALRRMGDLGLSVHLRKDVFEGIADNPKSLSVFREALRSLELNRWTEFTDRLSLLGIRVENREMIPLLRDRLLPQMSDMLRGALTVLGRRAGTDDPLQLAALMREMEEEIESLKELRNAISELPKEVRENLSRLESVGYLQSYLVAFNGRRFVLPFSTEEGRGVLGFVAEDVFRIFVKLSFEEGFLGIVMEAPRRESPDHVSIVFKTDLPALADAIRREERRLQREIEALGMEVKRLEILSGAEEVFEKELLSEFGGEGVFNLRV